MDSQYLQQQRYLLQKRVRRLNSCSYLHFHSLIVQFWGYLEAHPLFSGILAKLDAEAPSYESEVKQLLDNDVVTFEKEVEAREFCFRLLQHCARQPVTEKLGSEVHIGRMFSSSSGTLNEDLNGFREEYLEPFYEYLDESLDQHVAVLSLLLKYKRKVEWFEREHLAALAAKGERTLAEHMYAYLFDQGLNFHIEPKSASGEADLVASDLVLDAKVFDGSRRNLTYIKSGVHQLLTYTRDFHQSVGYLVIYRTCPEDLQFSFERNDSLVPFVCIGGRTLYLLVIDICDHEASASKRGTLRTYELSEQELREVLEESARPLALDGASST